MLSKDDIHLDDATRIQYMYNCKINYRALCITIKMEMNMFRLYGLKGN